MILLCAPDLHCWWPTFEVRRRGEIPERLEEWDKVTDALIDIAKAHSADVALFPGDNFYRATPEPRAVLRVLNLFKRFECEGIKVVNCQGNHDCLGINKPGPCDVLGEYKRHWGITQPQFLDLGEIGVVVLPFMKPMAICDFKDPKDIGSALFEKALKTGNASGYKGDMVLMGHWAVTTSKYANGFGPDNEPALNIRDLKFSGFKACIMGHIHKPQVLSEKPLILHTGVLTRGKTDEGNLPCGVYIVDTSDWSYEFQELPARKVVNVTFSGGAIDKFEKGIWKDEIPDVLDAVVSVKYTITESKAKQVSHEEIIDFLKSKGSHYVANITPTILHESRQRNVNITEGIEPLQAFKLWASANGEPEELIEDAMPVIGDLFLKAL